MLYSISETVNARAFKPLTLCSPENLLVGISGAVGTKYSHFLSYNMFSENAVEYLRNSECQSFQTFNIVFSTPDNLLVEISGAPGMKESHLLS